MADCMTLTDFLKLLNRDAAVAIEYQRAFAAHDETTKAEILERYNVCDAARVALLGGRTAVEAMVGKEIVERKFKFVIF